MPRKKKPARELTSDELARRVFPRKVLTRLKKIANPDERPKKSGRKSSP
jgi:hypothetical protein